MDQKLTSVIFEDLFGASLGRAGAKNDNTLFCYDIENQNGFDFLCFMFMRCFFSFLGICEDSCLSKASPFSIFLLLFSLPFNWFQFLIFLNWLCSFSFSTLSHYFRNAVGVCVCEWESECGCISVCVSASVCSFEQERERLVELFYG